jgi:hypothetical protein
MEDGWMDGWKELSLVPPQELTSEIEDWEEA